MVDVLRSSAFPPPVIAAFSTRQGGVSPPLLDLNLSYRVGDLPENVTRNRARFFGSLGIFPERIVTMRQVHGADVVAVTEPGEIDAADGLVTDRPQLFLCVTVADCAPVLLYDPAHHAVGAVHAGWRGTDQHAVEKAVEVMKSVYATRTSDLLAHIGPVAAECCYEVGEEVARRFPAEYVIRRVDRLFLNLRGLNRKQLENSGISPANIQTSLFCTISDSTLFHSHRRDGARSGRMMAVIGLTA
jgi:YfiH family protein